MNALQPNPFSPSAVYRRLLSYAVPHWRIFAGAVLGMILFAAADTGFLTLIKPLLDESFVKRDPEWIRWIPVYVIGLYMVRGVAGFGSTYGMAWVGKRIVTDLRGEVFNHLLQLPARFYDQNSSGKMIARLTYNVEQVSEATTSALTSVIRDGFTVIGLLGWMFYLNWELTLFCFVVGPVVAFVTRYVTKRFRRISERIQESIGNVTQAAEEAINAQRVVKINNGQRIEEDEFRRINEHNRFLSMKVVATSAGSAAFIPRRSRTC